MLPCLRPTSEKRRHTSHLGKSPFLKICRMDLPIRLADTGTTARPAETRFSLGGPLPLCSHWYSSLASGQGMHLGFCPRDLEEASRSLEGTCSVLSLCIPRVMSESPAPHLARAQSRVVALFCSQAGPEETSPCCSQRWP